MHSALLRNLRQRGRMMSQTDSVYIYISGAEIIMFLINAALQQSNYMYVRVYVTPYVTCTL